MSFLEKCIKFLLRKTKQAIKNTKILNYLLRKIYNKLPFEIKFPYLRWSEKPYRDIENDNKIIFVHIPKAAGNGIKKSLFNHISPSAHYPLIHYKKDDIRKFNSYFKFTIVRNPWDRMISAFFFLKQGGKCIEDAEFAQRYLKDFKTPKEFILKLQEEKFREKMLKWIHFSPQYTFLCDEAGEIAVDYIGRFESIEDDSNYIKNRLMKQHAVLRRHNPSHHQPFWEYYDEEMVEIVRELYKKDIELFEYDFPYEKLKKET